MKQTREEWLNSFARLARKAFDSVGYPIPENVRMSVGFPSTGGKSKRIGECWSAKSSKDDTFEIFVSPYIAESSRVAGILTHELVHAAVGLDKKHGKIFKKCATDLGLEGKMTATTEGKKWHEWAGPLLDKLGPIPHAELVANLRAPSESKNRHIKCECSDCGTIFRMSQKTIDGIDEFHCPRADCGGEIVVG